MKYHFLTAKSAKTLMLSELQLIFPDVMNFEGNKEKRCKILIGWYAWKLWKPYTTESKHTDAIVS